MDASKSHPSQTTHWRAWYTISLLSIAYTLSAIDRLALSLITDDVKQDLSITDTQFSLLTGLAFAAIYTFSAIPLARISDHHGRKWVIVAGVFLWGAMTAACGLAESFFILFIFRMGVGLGEATLTANAYAFVPEIFDRKNQARAMSLFIIGGALGYGGSLLFGGLLIGFFAEYGSPLGFLPESPWRLLLLTFGGITLMLVLPLMGIMDSRSPKPANATLSASKVRVFPYFKQHFRAMSGLMIGAPLLNIVAMAMLVWLPPFFIRTHGWDTARTGLTVGIVLILVSIATAFAAGWIATRFSGPDRARRIMGFLGRASLLAAPLLTLGVLVGQAYLAIGFIAAAYGLVAFVSTLAPLALQDSIPAGARAQFSAVFLLVANLAGLAIGPTLVALVTDYVLGSPEMVGIALGTTGLICLLAAAATIFASNEKLSALSQDRLADS
ncbi:MAG: MFS transporter [Hyphomonadaceae bacterium]|nr:MFS transporter [Hyphomonadaceae bacterium]